METTPVPQQPRRQEIHPSTLEKTLVERMDAYQTGRLFKRLERAIRRKRITQTWEEYMDIMNLPTNTPQTTVQPNGRLTLAIPFESIKDKNAYSRFLQPLLRGNPNVFTSEEDSGDEKNLVIENFGHEDLATLGRVGSALFLAQYGRQLRQNIHLVFQRRSGDISAAAVEVLPEALRDRLAEQRAALEPLKGEDPHIVEKSLLTSGIGISRMGFSVRKKLKAYDIVPVMQRPPGTRPAIEEDIDFYGTSFQADGLSVSRTTLSKVLKGQIDNDFEKVKRLFTEREVIEGVMMLWELGGNAKNLLITSTARAVGTTICGTTAVLEGFFEDGWEKRLQREDQHLPRQEHQRRWMRLGDPFLYRLLQRRRMRRQATSPQGQ